MNGFLKYTSLLQLYRWTFGKTCRSIIPIRIVELTSVLTFKPRILHITENFAPSGNINRRKITSGSWSPSWIRTPWPLGDSKSSKIALPTPAMLYVGSLSIRVLYFGRWSPSSDSNVALDHKMSKIVERTQYHYQITIYICDHEAITWAKSSHFYRQTFIFRCSSRLLKATCRNILV